MIARSSALMDGVIICPKCEHKFFVGNTVSVEEVRANLIDYRTEFENNKAAVAKLNSEFNLIDDKAADKSDEVENINKIIKSRAAELNTEYSELVSYSKKLMKQNVIYRRFNVSYLLQRMIVIVSMAKSK